MLLNSMAAQRRSSRTTEEIPSFGRAVEARDLHAGAVSHLVAAESRLPREVAHQSREGIEVPPASAVIGDETRPHLGAGQLGACGPDRCDRSGDTALQLGVFPWEPFGHPADHSPSARRTRARVAGATQNGRRGPTRAGMAVGRGEKGEGEGRSLRKRWGGRVLRSSARRSDPEEGNGRRASRLNPVQLGMRSFLCRSASPCGVRSPRRAWSPPSSPFLAWLASR